MAKRKAAKKSRKKTTSHPRRSRPRHVPELMAQPYVEATTAGGGSGMGGMLACIVVLAAAAGVGIYMMQPKKDEEKEKENASAFDMSGSSGNHPYRREGYMGCKGARGLPCGTIGSMKTSDGRPATANEGAPVPPEWKSGVPYKKK
jgi:hypothetical protein